MIANKERGWSLRLEKRQLAGNFTQYSTPALTSCTVVPYANPIFVIYKKYYK